MSPDAAALLRYVQEAENNFNAERIHVTGQRFPCPSSLHKRYLDALMEMSEPERFKILFYCWSGAVQVPHSIDALIKEQQERPL
jgi:hypothetical protein